MVIRVYLKSTFIYIKFRFIPTCQAVVQPCQVDAGESKACAAFNLPREYELFQLLHHLLTIVEDFSRAHFLIAVQVANVVVRFASTQGCIPEPMTTVRFSSVARAVTSISQYSGSVIIIINCEL